MHLDAASTPVALLKVPAAHGVSAALPTGQNVPSLHTTQSATLFMTFFETFFVVPPGHGSGAAEPSAQ